MPRKPQKKPIKSAPPARRGRPPKQRPAPPREAQFEQTAPSEGEGGVLESAYRKYILPFLVAVAALYLFLCFAAPGAAGIGAPWVRAFFFGLFSAAAYFIPAFMIAVAFYMWRDGGGKFVKHRAIFSGLAVIFISAAVHLIASDAPGAWEGVSSLYEGGRALTAGGVVGGGAARLFYFAGPVIANILIWPLSIIFFLLVFGLTAFDVVRFLKNLFAELFSKEYRERGGEVLRRYRAVRSPGELREEDAPPPAPRRPFEADIAINGEERGFEKKAHSAVMPEFLPDVSVFDEAKKNIPPEKGFKPVIRDIKPGDPLDDIFGESDESEGFVDYDNSFSDRETIGGEGGEARPPKENAALKKEGSLGNLSIVESAPMRRDDDPELGGMSVETSRLFGGKPGRASFKTPPLSLLTKETSVSNVDISEELSSTASKLIETLASFGVKTKISAVSRGPAITRYEVAPDSGVRVSAITRLIDDISLNLATGGIRIEAPIPGKAAVGVEVPNKNVSIVHLRSLLEDPTFRQASSRLTVCLGMDVAGNPIYSDIAKMPHLLIAGATGSGKSVCITSILTSILYKATPDEVKMILIDPKKVEFPIYNGIPYLLVPVVTEPKKAAGALSWAVEEMERRFGLLEELGVRDIKAYNETVVKSGEDEPLPLIVVVIDELADLMMTAPADVEQSICRLAQKARAAGMHLIVGTQRPSVDVITGLIKANIPSRIAFTTASSIDSRTIIDVGGAEKLIGRGDMLYMPIGSTKMLRVQGAYISEWDVMKVIKFLKDQAPGEYDEQIMSDIERAAQNCNTKGAKIVLDDDAEGDSSSKESMFKPSVELAIETGSVSTSLLQRRLGLGYGRAARIIDRMERMNIIAPPDGPNKPRKVLISRQDYIEMLQNEEM